MGNDLRFEAMSNKNIIVMLYCKLIVLLHNHVFQTTNNYNILYK